MYDLLENSVVTRSLEMALVVDPHRSKAYVDALCRRFPEKDRRQLADYMIRQAQWWGASFGFITGVPGNPLIAAQAAFTDMVALLRTEVILACRIGLLFDRHFLDSDEPPYEILVPIMGTRAASEIARSALTIGGMELTRQAILKGLKTEGVTTFQRIMLRYLGMRITKRSLITRVVPLVGGVVGGGWNYLELKLVGDRVYRYFEGGGQDGERGAGGRPGEVRLVDEVPAETVLSDQDATAAGAEPTAAIESKER